MKVFISSLITGLEAERAAVKQAVELLRHEAVMAENFGSQAKSPQIACLTGLRQADLVVLILDTRYGAKQGSGLSATHEEYREARGRKPILTFIKQGEAEPDQVALISEAGSWESGLFRESFSSPEQLRDLVTRALHEYTLSHATGPLDPNAMARRAQELLPGSEHGRQSGVALQLSIAAGPETTILRPAELESAALAEAMQERALFGSAAVFDRRIGTDSRVQSTALSIYQQRSHESLAEVRVWGTGDIRLILPARGEGSSSGFSFVIEEEVASKLANAIGYAAWLLGHIDPTDRITHVTLAAALVGEGAMGWRTRDEHAASPNSGSFGAFGREREREAPVMLSPQHRVRAALSMDAVRIVEDLVVLLRRRWKDMDRGW
ncbi:hypothetical protein LYSHEL_27300 [Lysobacter helvus]|uniref:DUF4062 domain-containing protein n=2 Tax=Lysobacteraceae TaxID=32033 RepID=A0ABN6G1S5_9GAMM|nr:MULTISPECIES: DUF4062 domain-containing protein [Lysobacter]BCT93703.1 hypothetical protein LYSCAS_27270 [Lysobacter caseinilyticus]BCT96859.1 hypothetical protein LYSHEL_27300 [Lysobacter helvus]